MDKKIEMQVKLRVVSTVYKKNNYQILRCTLVEPNEHIKLNSYNNFILIDEEGELAEQHDYTLIVSEEKHPKYGVQYKKQIIIWFVNLDNISSEENYRLLLEIMNEQQAKYIHKIYPNFVSLIIHDQTDQIDINKIYNVGQKRFDSYCKKIRQNLIYWTIQIHFKEYKLSKTECQILYQVYNQENIIIEKLTEIPYIVLQLILKRSCTSVDRMLKELRPDLNISEQRCICLTVDALHFNELNGNTRAEANDIATIIYQYAPEIIPLMKETVLNSSYFHYEENTKMLGLQSTYNIEKDITDMITKAMSNPKILKIKWENYCNNTITLTDEQSQLLNLVTKQNIVLLTGGAGTGKSSAVNALINMIEDNNLSYTLLAPTGIASKRLQELTGKKSYTIHRFYMQYQTVNSDIVVIDEISMCGLEHFNMLCNAIDPIKTKIIMIGDPAQLCSISCGNVLYDLLCWGKIPQATLTKIFRYGKGSLDTVATDIRNGKSYLTEKGKPCFIGAEHDNQYEYIPLSNNPMEQITHVYSDLLKTYHPSDIMILSPFNVGELGTYNINNTIQEKYNKPQQYIEKKYYEKNIQKTIYFGVRDRVLNTENEYSIPCLDNIKLEEFNNIELEELENLSETAIFNGELGVIRHIDTINDTALVQFDEKIVYIDHNGINNLLLGNAISIHKAQGAQFKAIILITDKSHASLLTSNLLYVGVTRAQEKIVHLGDTEAIQQALQIQETKYRNTWLQDLLQQTTIK